MQTNILWTGLEYYSLENCLINTVKNGTEISSAIVGLYNNILYRTEYHIRTNARWETVFFEIKSQHNNLIQHIIYEADGKGNWVTADQPVRDFDGCIDIDIALTPFTNSLPINRLNLKVGEEQLIRVLYLDLLGQQFSPVTQRYIRLGETVYRYENVPNDFEADIRVDKNGFVIDYPGLFMRKAAMESAYK